MQPLENPPGDLPRRFGWQRYRLLILRTLGMVLATAVLLSFARVATAAPCWLVVGLVSLIALPVWLYRTEYLMFRRRLLLAGAARPESRIRAFLWKGGVSKGVQLVISLLLAWVLLALVSALPPIYWYVLGG